MFSVVLAVRSIQYAIATFVYNVIYRFNLPWNGLGRRQGGATTLSSSQTTVSLDTSHQ